VGKMNSAPFYGLVLAGGESSRMGRDKSSLILNGQSLRHRITEALAGSVDKVFLSLRHGQSAEDFNSDRILQDGDEVIRGPAAALLAAHAYAPEATWFAIACDFPFVNDDSVTFLRAAYEMMDRPAIMPVSGLTQIACYCHEDETPEPLFAIWLPEALRLLKQNVALGKHGPMHTLQTVPTYLVQPTSKKWLINTNTPDEWAQAEESLCQN
jgi:molybdenum cofactor guanylyltransferase